MILKLFIPKIVLLLFFLSPQVEAATSCNVSCGTFNSSAIVVDVKNRCLCIKGQECFKIDTGRPGRDGAQTTNGTGTMSLTVAGDRYRTLKGPGTTKSDRDAIDMNIPANSVPGKWIHKIQSCGPGGGTSTIGCVGVPCDKWPTVKAIAAKGGSRIHICNGVDYPTSNKCTGPGGRCDVPGKSLNKKAAPKKPARGTARHGRR